MFHKVAWQQKQGMVGFLSNQFTANFPVNLPVKKICKSVEDLTELWP